MTATVTRRPVLAWCTTCEAPFHAGRFGGGGMNLGPSGQDVHIGQMTADGRGTIDVRQSSAKCPVCGTSGKIQEGFYDTVSGVVREAAQIFRTLSPADAASLAEALQKNRQGEADDDEAVEASPPEVRNWLKKVLGWGSKEFWVSTLLTVLLTVHGDISSNASTRAIEAQITNSTLSTQQKIAQVNTRDEQLKKLIQELLDEETGESHHSTRSQAKARPPATTQKSPAIHPSREGACWCGSGRKYKRCHRGHE